MFPKEFSAEHRVVVGLSAARMTDDHNAVLR